MDFDPPAGTSGVKAKTGFVSVSIAQFIKVAIQFITVATLSRILKPIDFGIVATAGTVIGLSYTVQDLGFENAITQRREISKVEIDSVFWINLIFTIIIALILGLISNYAGIFYNSTEVGNFIFASSFVILVNGAGSIANAILTRRMSFETLSKIDVFSAIVGVVFTLLSSIYLRSFWAIFIGTIVSSISRTFLLFYFSKWLPSLSFKSNSLQSMLGFGSKLTFSNIMYFISQNADNLLVSKLLGLQALGIYDRAYKLLIFPMTQFSQPMTRIMVPLLARKLGNNEEYNNSFSKIIWISMFLVWPGVLCLAMLPEKIVLLVLGAQWNSVVPIFSFFSISMFYNIIGFTSGEILISQGRGSETVLLAVITVVTNIIAFILGALENVEMVALYYTIVTFLRAPVIWYIVLRSGPLKLQTIIRTLLPHLFALILTASMIYIFDNSHLFKLINTTYAILSLNILCAIILSYSVYSIIILILPSQRLILFEFIQFFTSNYIIKSKVSIHNDNNKN